MTLLFTLEAPLQRWTAAPRSDVADDVVRTQPFPTLSGVIGILGASLGSPRGEVPQWMRDLRMGVGIRKSGRVIQDYQTKEVPGTSAKKMSTAIFRVEYLSGAAFEVALDGDKEHLAQAREALDNPKWTIYLGAKACVPAQMDPELSELPLVAALDARLDRLASGGHDGVERVLSTEAVPADVFVSSRFDIRDIPLSSDPRHRTWASRSVSRVTPASQDLDFFERIIQ